jgi:hypothetical protein
MMRGGLLRPTRLTRASDLAWMGTFGGFHEFDRWRGDSTSTSPTDTIVKDSPKQVTAVYYYNDTTATSEFRLRSEYSPHPNVSSRRRLSAGSGSYSTRIRADSQCRSCFHSSKFRCRSGNYQTSCSRNDRTGREFPSIAKPPTRFSDLNQKNSLKLIGGRVSE